jgi:excisionase family DNA binding protein
MTEYEPLEKARKARAAVREGKTIHSERDVKPKEAARSSRAAVLESVDMRRVTELQASLEKLYTIQEVAAALNTTSRTVLSYIKTGRLKAVKVAAVWRIAASNLNAFLRGE